MLTALQIQVTELPFDYLANLSKQIIFISTFLGGVSATILGTFIIAKDSRRLFKVLIAGISLSAVSFIVSIFSWTNIVILTSPGYPLEVSHADTVFSRNIGGITFVVGILALLSIVALSGWLHSKRLGIITTALGLIGMVLIALST